MSIRPLAGIMVLIVPLFRQSYFIKAIGIRPLAGIMVLIGRQNLDN